MARGNCIIVTAVTDYIPAEGIVAAGETHYPGMVVQKKLSSGLTGGRETFEIYNADQDGGRPKGGAFYIVVEDSRQGRTVSDPYTAGERAFYAVLRAGMEFNGLVLNLTGTADDHAVGEVLIVDDTTGKFIATTGSPETEVAVLKETITDPTADTLAWMEWTGF